MFLDCGINCHKHCKERIVQECRIRPTAKSISTMTPLAKKRNKQRNKPSVSSESDISANGGNICLMLTLFYAERYKNVLFFYLFFSDKFLSQKRILFLKTT